MATQITKRLFTVHEYQRMAETGILSDRDRVELLNGEILAMSPMGPRHGAAVDRATRAMVNVTGDRRSSGCRVRWVWMTITSRSRISCCSGRRRIIALRRIPHRRTFC